MRSFLCALGVGAAVLVSEYDAEPEEAYDLVAKAAGINRWEGLQYDWNDAVALPPREAAQLILNHPTLAA